jgi:hypothetical protein
LLKDYKEAGTTDVTVGNVEILPANEVGNTVFQTNHGYVTPKRV